MKRVVWITGVSGAGKSAIGERLVTTMKGDLGTPCVLVDENLIRKQFWPHLGPGPVDRVVNVLGMAELTSLFVRAGNDVIVACIAPDHEVRSRAFTRIRKSAQDVAVYQVNVMAPLRVLRKRDHKGLCASRAADGLVELTGGAAVYEPPTLDEALCLDTSKHSVTECVQHILSYVKTTAAREWGRDAPEARRRVELARV